MFCFVSGYYPCAFEGPDPDDMGMSYSMMSEELRFEEERAGEAEAERQREAEQDEGEDSVEETKSERAARLREEQGKVVEISSYR